MKVKEIKAKNLKTKKFIDDQVSAIRKAVGKGLETYLEKAGGSPLCVSLETAHPAKFPDEIIELLSVTPELPPAMRGIDKRKGEPENLACDYGRFKIYLQDTLRAKD